MWDQRPSSCTSHLITCTSIRRVGHGWSKHVGCLVQCATLTFESMKQPWSVYGQQKIRTHKTSNYHDQTGIVIYVENKHCYSTKKWIKQQKQIVQRQVLCGLSAKNSPPPRPHQRRSKAPGSAPCEKLRRTLFGFGLISKSRISSLLWMILGIICGRWWNHGIWDWEDNTGKMDDFAFVACICQCVSIDSPAHLIPPALSSKSQAKVQCCEAWLDSEAWYVTNQFSEIIYVTTIFLRSCLRDNIRFGIVNKYFRRYSICDKTVLWYFLCIDPWTIIRDVWKSSFISVSCMSNHLYPGLH